MRLKRRKDLQVKTKSYSGWSLLSRRQTLGVDKRALSLIERTTVKIDGEDAYVSGLLWREEDPHLPNNFNMAKQKIKSLEKKFENNPEIREKYA